MPLLHKVFIVFAIVVAAIVVGLSASPAMILDTAPVTTFEYVEGGDPLGHAGFIPPTATTDSADIAVPDVPPATAVAPAPSCETITREDFIVNLEGKAMVLEADLIEKFGIGSGVVARLGPVPADVASIVFAWPPVGNDAIYVALFDAANCGAYEIYLSPDAIRGGLAVAFGEF